MEDFHAHRRYEIDWLRVLAFVTLIFYHIGMFYVSDWGWHVKSHYQSESLKYVMLLVNPWRMSLIFFISGFALCLVESKISSIRLLKIRFLRVFVPLLIGMYLIVPPQVYYQALANSEISTSILNSYLAFWLEYAQPSTTLLPSMHVSSLGLLTWNHLWYLAYLWGYTLIYLMLKPVFKSIGARLAHYQPSAFYVFLVPVIALTVYGLWLKPNYPRTNALFDDWYNHAVYFSVFLFGYLAAKSEYYLKILIKFRSLFIKAALFCYLLITVINKTNWFYFEGTVWNIVGQFLLSANIWFWILSVVGYAARYLNRPSPTLSYLNEAILPWYILHQSVIIVTASALSSFSLGGAIEALLLTVTTFLVCAVLFEIVKRWNISRFMFGMKLNETK